MPPSDTLSRETPVRDHAQTEGLFQASLWTPETPPFLGAGSNPDRRFAVYRNNVQKGLVTALSARFLVIERLVGTDFFAAMARVFIAAHPPNSPVLLSWGDAFPAFLESFEPVQKLPYLADVARLELARGRAYHADDHTPVDPSVLGQGDPSRLILRLAPSVQAFTSKWPAVSIWMMNQPGASKQNIPQGPEFALIARGPDMNALTVPLTFETFRMLGALLEGVPLGEAAKLTSDPTPLLTQLVGQGLIHSIEDPDL